jgi:TniQ
MSLPPLRWPLHPQPGPLESLSSWLERTAHAYPLRVSDLTGNLGRDGTGLPADIDQNPPAWMLAALAERTGAGVARLRAMTLAGWQPWLFDAFPMSRHDAQDTFATYVRANPVLLAPGEAGIHDVSRWKPWGGPWLPRYWLLRACPACVAGPARGSALMWRLPLTVSCADHGCRLESAPGTGADTASNGRPTAPVPEPLATLDRYTHEALATGLVTLPGRTVHAGVWFRLLRSLLDEVSLAGSAVSAHGRATLEQVWDAAGRPARGGLAVWRPYEQLDWEAQEAMLHAAAAALQLAADGQITARGALGSALRPAPHRHVYDGDQPSPQRPSAWNELMKALNDSVTLARTDRDAARHLLIMLTIGCRTLDRFEKERSYLSGIGIPAEFLPGAREIGRNDLA